MIIKSVRLVNFRNREDFTLQCEDKLTSILGENGCGKTSILEAIYEALQGRSWRAVDEEIVRRGADFYRVEVECENGEKMTVVYRGKIVKHGKMMAPAEKKFMVRGKSFSRLPQQYKYPIVLFDPDDLNLVGASPSRRRDYFDRLLGQIDERFVTDLHKYQKSLKQRNDLLKRGEARQDELFPWNVMLARYGLAIRRRRMALIQKINEHLTDVYRSIAENDDEVKVKYSGEEWECDEGGYLAKLEELWATERVVGHTLFGVHRDKHDFWFNNSLASGSASRGEVRSAVIALKFIEAEIILAKTGRRPLVLLDDVFSELDTERQQTLMQNFRKNQIILTSVS